MDYLKTAKGFHFVRKNLYMNNRVFSIAGCIEPTSRPELFICFFPSVYHSRRAHWRFPKARHNSQRSRVCFLSVFEFESWFKLVMVLFKTVTERIFLAQGTPFCVRLEVFLWLIGMFLLVRLFSDHITQKSKIV